MSNNEIGYLWPCWVIGTILAMVITVHVLATTLVTPIDRPGAASAPVSIKGMT